MSVIEQDDTQVQIAKITHWWLYILSRNRLFFRLLREETQVLAKLPYLDIILRKLNHEYRYLMRIEYPLYLQPFRELLLSAERNYIYYLRSVKAKQLTKADIYHNQTIADLNALQFMLLERGITATIS